MAGPLQGVRVLDLTTVVMGPFATQLLGDMGADVIKIEPPAGDSVRRVGPFHPGGADDMGPLFLQANRNKRSVVLDLKTDAGRAALLSLVPRADVLVYNIRPQAMRRLGLDHETLAAINPRLIVCGAYGFGENGPYAGRPAYDDILQAASGLVSLQQRAHGKPGYVPVNLCDRTVGLYLATTLLGALFHQQRTGEGQAIELPMFETMAQFVLGDHLGGQAFVPARGDAGYQRLLSTQRGPYPTQDGHLCVVVYTDEHWRRFLAMTGEADDLLSTDLRFESLAARTIHAEDVGRFLADQLATRTTGEWLALFAAADIPAGPVNSIDALFDDPHLNAVGFWQTVEHPTEGTLKVAGFPGTWSRTQPDIRRLAPNRGEHTAEVLAGARLTLPVREPSMSNQSPAHIALLRAAYRAFNARDIAAALALMTPDVAWPRAFKGGFVRGPDEVRAYWTAQWREIDPHVEPVAFHPEDTGQVSVEVHQVVRDLAGAVIADEHVGHRFTLNGGLIERMEVVPHRG